MVEVRIIERHWVRMEMWTETDHEGSYVPFCSLQTSSLGKGESSRKWLIR